MAGLGITQRQSAMEGSEGRYQVLRSPSISSDVTTRSAYPSAPYANPSPLFVARVAAGDLINAEIELPVQVTNSAISLVNEFLDQILYNILLASRSTSLGSLKAALPSVLKPRLAKAALRVAEEELKDYLNDEEELSLHTRVNPLELKHDFDPDLTWRLARLRCMVYTRLGDMEEEDEEDWLEREGLRAQLETARRSVQASIETGPASAIFLTAVLEYLGEQALYYAAQHAQKRYLQYGNQQIREEEVDLTELPPNFTGLIVGGKDMNHVGRDSPLSRLWRTYRRNTRESGSRPMSPEIRSSRGLGLSHSRTPSAPYESVIIEEERSPAQIPLPISGNDINEIEVPGIAPAFSDAEEEESDEEVLVKRRPASMIDMPGAFPGRSSPDSGSAPKLPQRSPLRPTWMRKRSVSSPVVVLSKMGISRKDSVAQTETVNTSDNSNVIAQLHEDLDPNDPFLSGDDRPDAAEAEFGGAVAAVAGALGIGALGLSEHEDYGSQAPITDASPAPKDISRSPSTQPKKTVAEEMLGSGRPVAPPKDAKTGSSITNVSDFHSMHVPATMSSGAYEDLTPRAENINPLLNTRAVDGLQSSIRSAPPKALPGQPTATQPNTAVSVGRLDSGTANSRSPNAEPARTIIQDNATPISGSYEQPRELSQTRHVKADSYSSANLPHSRTSSTSSRLLGSVKDASARSPLVPQQRAAGTANEEVRRTTSPSAMSVTRDVRPGTGNSSVSKRFHGKPLQLGDDSDEAKKKSLEVLIRGNETLHYTLTPAAALRDDPSLTQKIRTPTQDTSEFLRNTSPRIEDQGIRAKPNGITSVPTEVPSSPTLLVQRVVHPSSPRGVVTPASPTRPKNPLGEPREARAKPTSSTRDLADYARSTGPSDAKQLPLPVRSTAEVSTSSKPATVASRIDNAKAEPASPTVNRPASRLKFQARDARTSRQGDTSQLIDFIREGPSSGREHRIDRNVAPFRTTMDSEDFDILTEGRPVASSFRGSEDGHHSASVDPSVNSQTPLIVSNGRVNKNAVPAAPSRDPSTDPDGMPKRTRRRIKDPYAIYDSDDEDLDDEAGAKGSRNQEESLMDFLRNTAPPPGMKPQPLLTARPSSRTMEQLRTAGPREASPHLTQSGSKIDKYRPTQPTHAPHVDRNRATLTPSITGSGGRSSSQPRFEARDAKATRANTAELAEYLKNSGPPPNAQFQPQPFVLSISSSPQSISQPKPPTPKQESGLFKRFSKIRK